MEPDKVMTDQERAKLCAILLDQRRHFWAREDAASQAVALYVLEQHNYSPALQSSNLTAIEVCRELVKDFEVFQDTLIEAKQAFINEASKLLSQVSLPSEQSKRPKKTKNQRRKQRGLPA